MEKNTQEPPYRVVSCQLHSELELAIMSRKTLQVHLEKESLVIEPYDMVTRKNAGEFLLAKLCAHDATKNGEKVEIRLDHIKDWKLL